MEKTHSSPRYVIDITGTDLLCLRELGGRLILKNLKKLGIFNLRRSDQILMKCHIYNDVVTQISYFKFRRDLASLGGVRGNRKSCKTLKAENALQSRRRDLSNQEASLI